jgi:hypothetical protein
LVAQDRFEQVAAALFASLVSARTVEAMDAETPAAWLELLESPLADVNARPRAERELSTSADGLFC